MDQREASKLRYQCAALLLSAAIATPSFVLAADKTRVRNTDSTNSIRMHGTPVAGGSERVQVFVQLDEPAVAELNAASVEATGEYAPATAQRQQAERVSAQQSNFRSLLAQYGAEVLSTHARDMTVLHACAAGTLAYAALREALRSLPSVAGLSGVPDWALAELSRLVPSLRERTRRA